MKLNSSECRKKFSILGLLSSKELRNVIVHARHRHLALCCIKFVVYRILKLFLVHAALEDWGLLCCMKTTHKR